MKRRGLGLLALACASFGAALSHATVIEPEPVNDAAITGTAFPKALSEFAFFQDARDQHPSARVARLLLPGDNTAATTRPSLE